MANAPGPFITLDVLNNKFPCEGPEVVPLFLDFSLSTVYDINLLQLVQAGKISMIQSLYIDNADNTQPLTIVTSVQQQRIIVPAGAQAYLAGLFSGAQFSATSPGSSSRVKVFAQNFPVTNCVWSTGAAGAPSSLVTVANFPASQIVTLDRTASDAFQIGGTGASNLAVAITSTNVVISAALGSNVRLTNVGAGICYVRLGSTAQTAVVGDLAIVPNGSIILSTQGLNNLAVIGSAVSTLNICAGSGGI